MRMEGATCWPSWKTLGSACLSSVSSLLPMRVFMPCTGGPAPSRGSLASLFLFLLPPLQILGGYPGLSLLEGIITIWKAALVSFPHVNLLRCRYHSISVKVLPLGLPMSPSWVKPETPRTFHLGLLFPGPRSQRLGLVLRHWFRFAVSSHPLPSQLESFHSIRSSTELRLLVSGWASQKEF